MSQAPGGTIPVSIDLSHEASLQSCVNRIIAESAKIDLLVNNAGIAYVGPVDSLTLQETKNLFETNFFGAFRLTQLVLPYMRHQKNGRIIFISSIRGVESCAYMGMYSASKAALEAIAFDWAATLSKWNITVSVVQPGPLNTGIELKQGSYFKDKKDPYFFSPGISLDCQPVDEAAKAIIEEINSPHPSFRVQTSQIARDIVARHLKDPSGSL